MRALLFLLMLTTAAMAQTPAPVDPALMQKAITALINQRNSALNAQADAEARLAQLTEDNAKLKAENEELKKPK